MSLEVVNGYVCHSCADVSLAKKGVDPARPKDGPEAAPAADAPPERAPAVTLGGALAGAADVERVRPSSYVPGASVSLTA